MPREVLAQTVMNRLSVSRLSIEYRQLPIPDKLNEEDIETAVVSHAETSFQFLEPLLAGLRALTHRNAPRASRLGC